jgi:polyisoprenoid-binding protein YceI
MKTWTIDKIRSTLSFSVKRMPVSTVRGTFKCWTGSLYFDPNGFETPSAVACIDAASIDTDDPTLDDHLRSVDFLNVEMFPFVFFRSTSVRPMKNQTFQLSGEVTIRGVTREVTIDMNYSGSMIDECGHARASFSARGTVSRKAFGIPFNAMTGPEGLALDDKIELLVEVEAVESVSADAAMEPERIAC